MDPISAIGDERRRMVENTQRSSSSLHAQVVKRHKDRIKRGNVSSSYRAGETEEDFDGDFMAGDEDELDYSGGGDNADLFRQMWEDDVEANQPEPMAGDTIFEEVQSSGLLGSVGEYGDEGTETGDYDTTVNPPLAAMCSADADPDGECTAVVELSAFAESATGETKQDAEAEGEGLAGEEREADQLESANGGVPVSGSSVQTDRVLTPASRDEAVPSEETGSSPEVEEAGSALEHEEAGPSPEGEASGPALEQISMGAEMAEIFSGLDSFFNGSEGALQLEGRADIMQMVSSPALGDSMPRAALPPVSADIGQVLDKLIIGCAHSESMERLRSLLGRFGKGVLSCCVARGIKVHVVPPGQLAGVDVLRGASGVADICGGVYNADNRTCYLDEQAVNTVTQGSNPVLFFMAQAWDHALGEDDFASLHAPAVLANFEACRMACEGHCFSDSLVAASPIFYFAQAVEAYLAENDCTAELWNREDLYDLDRSMYDYVEYLFKQGNK